MRNQIDNTGIKDLTVFSRATRHGMSRIGRRRFGSAFHSIPVDSEPWIQARPCGEVFEIQHLYPGLIDFSQLAIHAPVLADLSYTLEEKDLTCVGDPGRCWYHICFFRDQIRTLGTVPGIRVKF